MGRTGWPFAAQHHGVTPDILTTAKGLAGGFPAAAMLVGDELAGRVKKGDLGTTFGAGPMACALIEAVVTSIEQEDLLPRVRRLSARLREECVRGPVESVQGLGFLLGLKTRVPAKGVLVALRERGILAGGANDPNVVRLLPPLILEDAHVDQLVSALGDLR
jgi:acetylornithine/succinyldiaminopimelate/putrescine aminotransferase